MSHEPPEKQRQSISQSTAPFVWAGIRYWALHAPGVQATQRFEGAVQGLTKWSSKARLIKSSREPQCWTFKLICERQLKSDVGTKTPEQAQCSYPVCIPTVGILGVKYHNVYALEGLLISANYRVKYSFYTRGKHKTSWLFLSCSMQLTSYRFLLQGRLLGRRGREHTINPLSVQRKKPSPMTTLCSKTKRTSKLSIPNYQEKYIFSSFFCFVFVLFCF